MAVDPRQEILRMMMAQQGGGMPAPQGMPQGMPPGGASAGLPPEIMQLAAAGIGPQDVMRGGMMGGGPPDRAHTGAPDDVDPMESFRGGDTEIDSEDETNVPPMSDEPPHDPRFGPNQDPVRDETEGELADVRSKMGAEGGAGDGDYEWEGNRTPTPADLEYVREHPTDSILHDFFQQFPDWTAEDILMRGGNPSESPDQYATSDEEWERMQSDRSTRIDER